MKRELEQNAKLIKDTNPSESIKIYREIWDNYKGEFNSWDALFTIQILRKINCTDVEIDWAFELAEKFPEEKVINLFGWLVFDKLVKNVDKQILFNNESNILKMAQIVSQKNLRDDDSYPCPVTISIFKLTEVYSENLFNASKISNLLSFLNPEFLNLKSKTIETSQRGDIELASDYEKYYALKTKAHFKLGDFSLCIESCDIALSSISAFHYNNDLWFKMRIALSEDKLGNHLKGEELLEEILKSKAGGDKWFIYRDVSEIYFEQKDYIKAWKFAVEATYYGNEPHFLIGLFLLQAKILFKLNRVDEGKLFAELIASILKENGWGEKQEYSKLFVFYKINSEAVDSVKNLFSKAQIFWNHERYGDLPLTKGVIISIHGNGKKGRIKDDSGVIIDFHKKDLKKKLRTIESLKNSKVEFYCIKLISGELRAECIDVLSQPIVPKNEDLIGKSYKGFIDNVVEFGIFVKFDNYKGLIHKNSLPNDLKESYEQKLKKGDLIDIIVDRVTEKGYTLKIITK
jgi:hypothetical protein